MECNYHFNFIYNSQELQETTDNLLATRFVYYLDEKISGWGKKCYIKERDCIGGSNIFDELLRIVSETDKCIVIITPEFRTNYWAKYCKQAALKYLMDKTNQHKMIPITLNITNISSMRELLVNDPFHVKGSNEEEWENNTRGCLERLKKTLTGNEVPHVAEEQGDNRLHTEVQQQLVTVPSSATYESNNPFFAENSETRVTEVMNSTLLDSQEVSFVSVDGPPSSTSIIYDRPNNIPLPQQNQPEMGTNGRQEERDPQNAARSQNLRLQIDELDGLPNLNTLEFDSDSGFENYRPDTIGGNENLTNSEHLVSSTFLEVSPADETIVKQLYSRGNTFNTPEDPPQNIPLDFAVATPPEATAQTYNSSSIDEHRPENQTDDQKHVLASHDSISDCGEASKTLMQNAEEDMPNYTSGIFRKFVSITLESFLKSDVAFK